MIRRRSLAAAILLVQVAAPAEAQVSSFLDGLFGRKPAEATQPAPEAPAEAAAPAAPATTARTPLPPRRPTALGGIRTPASPDGSEATPTVAETSGTRPQLAAVSTPASVAPRSGPMAPEEAVARANGYFNGVTTLVGDFVQIGADGRKVGGRLTLSRPGRLRFDYDQPSSLEVVADGTSVAVRDRRLATQDLYFIAQTPLKFLLRERIDLARDMTVTDVATDPGGVRITLEDRSTLGGTSRIVLFFDAELKVLSQWRITDPQGFQTAVVLSNLQRGRSVDNMLFVINYGRPGDQVTR